MSLGFDRAQVSPGSNVSLIAKADPESQVFIRIVDKSVLLLDDKNDITKDRVSCLCILSNSLHFETRRHKMHTACQYSQPKKSS